MKGDIATNAADMKQIIRGHAACSLSFQIYNDIQKYRWNGQTLSIIWITKPATRRLAKLTSAVTIKDI